MDDATRGRLRALVAQAIWVADEGPRRADEWWDAGEYEAVRAACFKRADAVLDALDTEAPPAPLPAELQAVLDGAEALAAEFPRKSFPRLMDAVRAYQATKTQEGEG